MKQGQSLFTVGFYVIVFVIVWAFFAGKWLNDTTASGVGLFSGLELLIWNNLNFIIFACVLIFVFAFAAGR